ncbi:hypothetical protein Pmani_008153 [Petrolisthes manimaculis]|uniref:SGNH hydrolase-type esterase domain-containing protein n=1 Tax=Petrolisthes manimaculis TaxID=1843537 RepID=A0AAE1Q693_9EUCA|nr:hypothetical protein Pmani_008153 [Petrolisthes manimaculis]
MMKIVEETREENRQLKRKYDSLQEFVTSNIAPGRQEESPLYSQVTRGTHRATPTHASVTPTRPPVSTPTPDPTPAATRPTDSPRISTGTNTSQARQVTASKTYLPIITSNRYQVLTEPIEEEGEIKLIGDSIIRGLLEEFCGRAPNNRKRYCIPGAGIKDIITAHEDITMDATNNTCFILHTGTNDLKRTKSEEQMEKYREAIR